MSGPGERIHFGSLEHMDREKLEKLQSGSRMIQQPDLETMDFSEKTLESQEKHKSLLLDFEQKKKARQMNLPTDDKAIQARLRELGEPIILFGEQAPERRDRLREVLARRGIDEALPMYHSGSVFGDPKEELFYTEGTPALKNARIWIAKYSLPRARERIERSKRKRELEDDVNDNSSQNSGNGSSNHGSNGTHVHSTNKGNVDTMDLDVAQEEDRIKKIHGSFNTFTATASQVGDERPLSFCSFSPDSSHLVTASWSGLCKIWSMKDNSVVTSFRGHTERTTSIVYHPQSGQQVPASGANLASSSGDQKVMLWSLESQTPLSVLTGHTHRVNRVAFHPSGRFLGSASNDMTWRLWDVETSKELLEQEGHSRALFAIGFQGDGSLVATGGQDKIVRLWDLRSGKSIYVMRGHSKQVNGIEFAPNGYQMATCSEDNTIRIWDLRKRRPFYTIPAHSNTISQIKFHPTDELIVSCSLDNTVKIWSAIDFTPIKTLKGEAKVISVDISKDSKQLVSANYDRTWKIYSHDELFS